MGKSILKLEASAGSGKTYCLALEYLGRLLQAFARKGKRTIDPKRERELLGSVLAITFTVKAAQGMKARIVEKLKRFALSPGGQKLGKADREFLDRLAGETKLDQKEIIAISANLIDLVLASYDDFNVKTIDSLMSAMVKAISPDLDLPADYEIAVEAGDELETRAHALIADQADHDWPRLLRTLEEFHAFDTYPGWKTDEAIGEKLIRLFYLDLRAGIDTENVPREGRKVGFRAHKTEFKASLEGLFGVLTRAGKYANRRVVNSRLLESVEAFPWDDDGLFQLEKLLDKSFFRKVEPGELLKDNDVPPGIAEEVMAAFGRMRSALHETVLDVSALKTLPYLEFFPDFAKAWLEKKDTLFVDEFSRTLAGRFSEWGKTGVPYLYLKMSDRFRHFLFDEFQDTSSLQFKALVPIIDEVLSRQESGSLFIVGDRKQAIYRWRGGNSELMDEAKLKEESEAVKNLWGERSAQTLGTNWRSREEIVRFNNEFWEPNAISKVAADPELREAIRSNFQDSPQGLPDSGERAGGYVEISLHVKNDKADGAEDAGEDGVAISRGQLEEIETIIGRLRSNGFEHSDIAVLVRKNAQVRDIIRHLGRKKIGTLSDQSLLLDADPRVREIIAFFEFLDYPPDDVNFHAFVTGEIFQKTAKKDFSVEMAAFSEEAFIGRRSPLYKRFQELFPQSWSGLIEPFFQAVGFLPPYDLFCDFCQVFQVYERFSNDTPYFMALGDSLHRAERQEGNSIAGFLRRWKKMVEDEGAPAVAIPENAPGVRVLTIHQSKGLEFPAVIVPLNERAGKGPDPLYLDKKELFYIKSVLASTDDKLGDIYRKENIRASIDLLNLLYVGFTRAREALFVPVAVKKMPVAPEADKQGLVKRITRTSDVVCHHTLPGWLGNGPSPAFIRGKLEERGGSTAGPMPVRAIPSKKVMTRSWQAEYLVFKKSDAKEGRDRSGARRGERIHDLLSRIGEVIDRGQLAARVRELATDAGWSAEDTDAVAAYLCREDVARLLRRGRSIHCEKEILDNSQPFPGLLRFDRLQVGPEEVLVIDFKTGKERDSRHEPQLRNYLGVLAPLFPDKKCSGWLLYIDRGEVAEVQCSS